jgi:hypothetical protein
MRRRFIARGTGGRAPQRQHSVVGVAVVVRVSVRVVRPRRRPSVIVRVVCPPRRPGVIVGIVRPPPRPSVVGIRIRLSRSCIHGWRRRDRSTRQRSGANAQQSTGYEWPWPAEPWTRWGLCTCRSRQPDTEHSRHTPEAQETSEILDPHWYSPIGSRHGHSHPCGRFVAKMRRSCTAGAGPRGRRSSRRPMPGNRFSRYLPK